MGKKGEVFHKLNSKDKELLDKVKNKNYCRSMEYTRVREKMEHSHPYFCWAYNKKEVGSNLS